MKFSTWGETKVKIGTSNKKLVTWFPVKIRIEDDSVRRQDSTCHEKSKPKAQPFCIFHIVGIKILVARRSFNK